MSLIVDSMDEIQRFIEERERSKKLQFQRQIEDTGRVLKEKHAYYRVLIQRIESKGKAIQDLVKGVKEGYVKICSLLQKEYAKILQQHKSTLSEKFKKFHSDFQKYRLTITSTSCASMTDIEQQISDFDVEIPALPQLTDFTFVENTDPNNDVSCAFGVLSSGRCKKESKKKHARCEQERYLNTQPDRIDASTQTEVNGWMPTEDVPCSDKNIQEHAAQIDDDNNGDLLFPTNDIASYCLRAVSNFKHANAFTALCATVDGAWIAFDRMKKVALVDMTGNVIRSVVAEDCVENICISTISARLWVACSDNRIVEYHEDGTTGVVLSVPNRPYCLCIMPDSHVVVGSLGDTVRSGGSISVYNTKGVKRNIMKGPQVRPLHMTSHRWNTTIAVVHGGNNCVTVYNGHLEPKYTYHGARRPFRPGGLCFHGDGNLFVCDYSSSSVLVLDDLGNCLTTVSLVSSRKPLVLSIDVNMIWVGYNDRFVKVSQIGFNA